MISESSQNNNPEIFEKFSRLIAGADLFSKTIFSREDFLLVLGGIKPTTDFELPKIIIEKYDINNFISRVESVGLKMDETVQPDDMFHAYIYNPKILAVRSQILEALIPFSESDDLNVWIDKNLDSGVGIDMILGSLLGFPQSSIDAYITYKKQTKNLHHAEKFGGPHERKLAKNILKIIREENRHFVESYGESYLIGDAKSEDVIEHEKTKKSFFEKLAKNEEFYKLWQDAKAEAEKNEDKLSWEAHN